MEFVIAKKDFESALKQILVGRETTSKEPVDVTVDGSSLRLRAKDTGVEVPVETKAPGVARVSVSNIAGLKKISRTYKAGPVNVRIADGYIRVERTSLRIDFPEAKKVKALFPDEDSAVFPADQVVEPKIDYDKEHAGGGKQMSKSEMQAELERLRAENTRLKNKDKGGISLKVSEKGAISLYGMGRFPVTLYKEQWLRVLESAAEIKAFIHDNEAKLKTKE